MANNTMACDCCGGTLPMREVWESRRDGGGDCTGSVDADGRCRAFDDDDWALNDMAAVLNRHGSKFSGNNVADKSQDWVDNSFSPSEADEWCEIGVWDAAAAAEFRDAEKTPAEISAAAERLVEAETAEWDAADEAAAEADDDWRPVDRESKYTDGDPIYAACNNDISAKVIINTVEG